MSVEKSPAPHIMYALLTIACFIGVLYSADLIPSESTRIVLLGLLSSLVVGIIFNAIVKESSLPFFQSEKITLGGTIGAFVVTLGIFLFAQHELSKAAKERDDLKITNGELTGEVGSLKIELADAKKMFLNSDEKNGIHSSYVQAIPNLFSSSPSPVPMDLFLEIGCVGRVIHPDDFNFTGLNLSRNGENLVGSITKVGRPFNLDESRGLFYAHIGESFANESKFVAEIDFNNESVLLPQLSVKLGAHNPCAPEKFLNIDIDELISRIENLPANSYLEVGSDIDSVSEMNERQRVTSALYKHAIEKINDQNNPWLLLLGQLSKGWDPVNGDNLTTLYSFRNSSDENRNREIDRALSNAIGSFYSCKMMKPNGVSGHHDKYTCFNDFGSNYPSHELAMESEIRAIGILFNIALSNRDNNQQDRLQDLVTRYSVVTEEALESSDRSIADTVNVFTSLADYFLGNADKAMEIVSNIDPHASATIDFSLLGTGECGLPNEKFTTSIVLQSLANIYTKFEDIGLDNENRIEIICTAINSRLTRTEKSGYYIKVAEVSDDDLNGSKAKTRWVEKVNVLYNDLLVRYDVDAEDFVHILQEPGDNQASENKSLVVAFGIPPSAGNSITDSDSCELEKRFRLDGISAIVIGGVAGSCV